MGAKRFRQLINNFSGGRSFDTRLQELHRHELVEHFDPFVSPRKLIPFRDMEANGTGSNGICAFAHQGGILYGLGKDGATSLVKLYEKVTNNITGDWAACTTGASAARNRNVNCFIPYTAGVDFLFGLGETRYVWSYCPSTDTFTDSAYDTGTFTTCTQAMVTRDDLLLVAYDNKIAKKDGGASATDNWSVALTLPSWYSITDFEEWGDYVAIAVKPSVNSSRNLASKLFIWDKVSEDVSDVIDFGEGELKLIGNIEGTMLGIMECGTVTGSAYSIKPRLVIKAWVGGQAATTMFEMPIFLDTSSDALAVCSPATKVKDGNRLVFGLDTLMNGVEETALWCVGRMPGYPFVLEKYIKCNNDTAVTSIEGAYKLGQYWFAAINAAGTVMRTNDQAANSFTANSRLVTQKIDGTSDDPDNGWRQKRLTWVCAYFEPLKAKTTVTLEVRQDHATSWTSVATFTEAATTANTRRLQASMLADGTDFAACREFQFRFSTAGGTGGGADSASLLGLEYEYELVDVDDTAS